MQTLIGLLLQEQSDLGLHCLHMHFVRKIDVLGFRTFTYSEWVLMTPIVVHIVALLRGLVKPSIQCKTSMF